MSVSFADLGVPSNLVDRLAAQGITEAFPIQEEIGIASCRERV